MIIQKKLYTLKMNQYKSQSVTFKSHDYCAIKKFLKNKQVIKMKINLMLK